MSLADIEVAFSDFQTSAISEVIQGLSGALEDTYDQSFLAARKIAEESGETRVANALGLLEAATSPMMQSNSPNDPYKPKLIMDGRRSPLPEDFTDAQIGVIKQFASTIGDPQLKARLADIVWVKNRDHDSAAEAATSYIEISKLFLAEGNIPDAIEVAERALRLAAMVDKIGPLFDRAGANIEKMSQQMLKAGALRFVDRVEKILLEFRIGDPTKHAELCESVAKKLEAASDWLNAKDHWEVAAKWHQRNEDVEAEKLAKIALAECFVSQAQMVVAQKNRSFMVATSWLEKAIVSYRRIPGQKSRTDELRAQLREWQPRIREEMGEFTTKIDASDVVNQVIAEIRGATFIDAIFKFARLTGPTNPDKCKQVVLSIAEKHPFQFLVKAIVSDHEGKTVVEIPPLLASEAEEYERALRYHMVKQANMEQNLNASTMIEIARQIINEEHVITLDHMLEIAQYSPFVPEGRELIFARGFKAGFDRDFLGSSHLLVPQVENAFRVILQSQGVNVATFNNDGTQELWTLPQILRSDDFSRIFGEKVQFDLQALLTEKFGSNLRNDVSHGLLSEQEFSGSAHLYFFWLIFKLVVLPLISQYQLEVNDAASTGPSGET